MSIRLHRLQYASAALPVPADSVLSSTAARDGDSASGRPSRERTLPLAHAQRLLLALSGAAVATLALTGCEGRVKDTHPQQWVSKRQAVFKDFTRTLEPMGLMAREKKPFDAAAFKVSALRLQELSTQPWSLFTPDSNYEPTLAKPQLWEQPQVFKEAQDAFVASVANLQQAAQAGTLAAARPAVEDVQQRCKACHDQFRVR